MEMIHVCPHLHILHAFVVNQISEYQNPCTNNLLCSHVCVVMQGVFYHSPYMLFISQGDLNALLKTLRAESQVLFLTG